MPRQPKPYFVCDHYVSRAGGELIKLCHRSEGRAALKEHLKRREGERERKGGRVPSRLTVSELFVMFPEAVHAKKSGPSGCG